MAKAPPGNMVIGTCAEVSDADAAYRQALRDVLTDGNEITAGDTQSVGSNRRFKEILNYNVVIANPRERLLHNPKLKFNIVTAVARFIWMMAGNDRLKDIAFYEKKVSPFTDDGVIVPGSSYGHRLIYPAPGCNQIEGALARLREDSSTRRAAMAVFQPEDVTRVSKDIPCTFGLAFHNRGNLLHSSVVMRSNNAFTLLPFNMFEFSLLAEAMAAELDLGLGPLCYHAISMHVYAENFASAQEVIDAPPMVSSHEIPVMPNAESAMSQIRELVRIEADARHGAAGFSASNFERRWLPYADSRLKPYWRQFYYILLWGMCREVGFAPGMIRLREFIDEPWLSRIPKEVVTKPTALPADEELDLFSSAHKKISLPRPDETMAVRPISKRADSTAISRADLEHELELFLETYRPYVAPSEWSRIITYTPTFVDKAMQSKNRLQRVCDQLQRLQFPLETTEKVETHRAKADLIIEQLERLLVD